MHIRFVSTLTAHDEEQIAPSLLTALTALLDRTGLAYTLRIETSGERVYQYDHPAVAVGATSASVRKIGATAGRSKSSAPVPLGVADRTES